MDGIRVEIGSKVIEKARKGKVRSDKRICVKTNLSQDAHNLLHRLSSTLRTSKTKLATEIVETMLVNPTFLNWIQDKYRVEDQYRITPANINGKITY